MNALTGNADFGDTHASHREEACAHTLRRTGRKALRFHGWRLVEALGTGEPGTMWYDLTLYRANDGSIIVELVARRHVMDEPDLSRVEVFATLQDAATWLEAYPAGTEVPIPAGLEAGDGPMATAILQSVQLRQRIARIRDDYHCLLSDVFEVLDITDAPAARTHDADHDRALQE